MGFVVAFFFSVLMLMNSITAFSLDKDAKRNKVQTLDDVEEAERLTRRATVRNYTFAQFTDEMLNAHNTLRAKEALDEKASFMYKMETDSNLAKSSQLYAEKCRFTHSKGKRNYGENLLFYKGGSLTFKSAVERWYNEKEFYNYTTQVCRWGSCGHYTQVVWARSKYLGCGIKKCNYLIDPDYHSFVKDAYFIVCRYSPRGNYRGVPYKKAKAACQECPENCVDGSLCETSYEVPPPCKDAYSNCAKYAKSIFNSFCVKGSLNYAHFGSKCKKSCNLCCK